MQEGLDSRYVVSELGYADRVDSVTTISTPHRGSILADVSLGLVGHARGGPASAGAALPGVAADGRLYGAIPPQPNLTPPLPPRKPD